MNNITIAEHADIMEALVLVRFRANRSGAAQSMINGCYVECEFIQKGLQMKLNGTVYSLVAVAERLAEALHNA